MNYDKELLRQFYNERGYIDAIAARANGHNKEYTEYMLHVTERSYRNILRELKQSKIL